MKPEGRKRKVKMTLDLSATKTNPKKVFVDISHKRHATDWGKYIINREYRMMSKVASFREAFDDTTRSNDAIKAEIKKFEKSPTYDKIHQLAEASIYKQLKNKSIATVNKMIDMYSQLLDEGNRAIAEATNAREKTLAMDAQRKNLEVVHNPINQINNIGGVDNIDSADDIDNTKKLQSGKKLSDTVIIE